jgi:hypothetical protein
MAVSQIENFEPVESTHMHVLIESWYHCRRVRNAAHKRGWEVSCELKSNRYLRLIHEDDSLEWLKLSEYAAHLTQEDWQEVS